MPKVSQLWQILPAPSKLVEATVSDAGKATSGRDGAPLPYVEFTGLSPIAKLSDSAPLVVPVAATFYRATVALPASWKTFVTGPNHPVVYTGSHSSRNFPVMAITMPISIPK